ncbi:hypothetical protein, partial [Bradyrhizobium sp. 164]|uniref:hypothetical protein n=1 Tax=Bradyrhizobium sp. 164 TaxID=2782637 RepID=UPI001FFA8DE8
RARFFFEADALTGKEAREHRLVGFDAMPAKQSLMRRRNHAWRFDGILKMKLQVPMPQASKPCNRKTVHKDKCDPSSIA